MQLFEIQCEEGGQILVQVRDYVSTPRTLSSNYLQENPEVIADRGLVLMTFNNKRETLLAKKSKTIVVRRLTV